MLPIVSPRARGGLAAALALLVISCSPRTPDPAPAAARPSPQGVVLRLTRVPEGTPAGAAIHVAGTFNGWDPASPAWRLSRDGAGWSIVLPDSLRRPMEFKFTLGSWERVETSASGASVPNRGWTPPAAGPAEYAGTVEGWQSGPVRRAPTASAGVTVLDTAFAIPALGRTRRILVYLPPGYATSGLRYPVIYMMDGQNVFDDATSFAGEWGIDETLDSLHALGDRGAIVVAIDHGGQKRNDEYHPWPSGRFGGGEGDRFVDFIVRTLKPHVDARYRTVAGREGTAIVGSSSGGLIAFYALVRHPDVFGRVGAFSPAFLVNDTIFALARATAPRAGSRVYMLSGLRETVGEWPDTVFSRPQHRMRDTLLAAGWDSASVRSVLPEDGRHSEWFWRREFPAAYRWLFPEARGAGR